MLKTKGDEGTSAGSNHLYVNQPQQSHQCSLLSAGVAGWHCSASSVMMPLDWLLDNQSRRPEPNTNLLCWEKEGDSFWLVWKVSHGVQLNETSEACKTRRNMKYRRLNSSLMLNFIDEHPAECHLLRLVLSWSESLWLIFNKWCVK